MNFHENLIFVTNWRAIREAFIRYAHSRFMKSFQAKMPFGEKEAYAEEVRKAGLEGLTYLIKVCGFLMQTKVYLFWGT